MEAKMKSPLEVFNFPDPPKDPPKNSRDKVNHFKVRNELGQFDEYAVLAEQKKISNNSSSTTPHNFKVCA